jgi:hypothetical protein
MVTNAPAKPKWLDFWVICDEAKAHLFYTSLDGQMWRRETKKADFPVGWSEPVLALRGDIFEASHTYKLKGRSDYLTIIEAQQAALLQSLPGPTLGRTLAGPWIHSPNRLPPMQRAAVARMTTSISHGELLRAAWTSGWKWTRSG